MFALFYCFVFIFRDYNYKNAGSLIPTLYQLFWWILLTSLFINQIFFLLDVFLLLFQCQFSYFIQICSPWATCKLVFIAYLVFYSIFSSDNSKISFHLFPFLGRCFIFILTFCVCDSIFNIFKVSLVQFRVLCWSFFLIFGCLLD